MSKKGFVICRGAGNWVHSHIGRTASPVGNPASKKIDHGFSYRKAWERAGCPDTFLKWYLANRDKHHKLMKQ